MQTISTRSLILLSALSFAVGVIVACVASFFSPAIVIPPPPVLPGTVLVPHPLDPGADSSAQEASSITQTQSGQIVTTSNGFQYTLPDGWHIGQIVPAYFGDGGDGGGESYYPLLDRSGSEVATVYCPSLGTYDSAGVIDVATSSRMIVKNGVAYDLSLTIDKPEIQNAGNTSQVQDAVVYVIPDGKNPDSIVNTPDFNSTCAIFGDFIGSTGIPPEVVSGIKEIYTSWQ